MHVYEIYIKAQPEAVWQAITDPDWTRRYFHATAFETSLEPGSGHRFVLPDGRAAVDGTVEEVEPGRRLVITWHPLYDVELAAEPPGRVEWSLHPANADGTVTRLRVRHYDLGLSPATWANVRHGWVAVIDGLQSVLETGAALGAVDVPDGTEGGGSAVEETVTEWHRQLGVSANNSTWELLDGRTREGDAACDALGGAYAAAHHWRRATGPESINSARAAWLCCRVHAVLGDGDAALRLAERCNELTAVSADARDFDRVYALEGRARALACLGRHDEARDLRQAATEATAAVEGAEDRKIAERDLAAPPWFGL
jgi:uncharacterized protein YndB with AHSA1/START domain